MTELEALLASKKFDFAPAFDNQIHRFDRNGKRGSGWFVGQAITVGENTTQFLTFGDFATGEKYDYWSRKAQTKEEAEELGRKADAARKQFLKAKREAQKFAQAECRAEWAKLPEKQAEITPYQKAKGLAECVGARERRGTLYVPITDTKGRLHNIQRIWPNGTKRFWPGGAIQGHLFFVNGYDPAARPTTIYLTEGYATGASVFEALRSRASAPLSAHAGAGDGGKARRLALSDASQVARDPAHDSTRDGAIPETPRPVRCGYPSTREAPQARGQRGEDARADRRARLEHELLAALSSTHAQSGENGRAVRGRGQGIPAGRSSPGPGQGDDHSPESGALGSGESRTGAHPRDAGRDGTGGQDGPANGQARGALSDRSGPREAHQGGTEALPHGNGTAPRSFADLAHDYDPALDRQAIRGFNGDRKLLEELEARGSSFIVTCAFTAGNLTPSAKALRRRYPDARLLICADDDRRTTDPVTGHLRNPGRLAAKQAALEVDGLVALPHFTDSELSTSPTDFNDLLLLPDGPRRILSCLALPHAPQDVDDCPGPGPAPLGTTTQSAAPLSPAERAAAYDRLYGYLEPLPLAASAPDRPGDSSGAGGQAAPPAQGPEAPDAVAPPAQEVGGLATAPLPAQKLVKQGRRGAIELPTQQVMADHLLTEFDGQLVKQEMDLFKYRDTHWRHLDRHGLDTLSMVIQDICDGHASGAQIDGYIDMLRRAAPAAPTGRNMFAADPWCANFKNGTLHVVKRPGNTFSLDFRPHNPLDYVVNVLPFTYRPLEELAPNPLFDKLLSDIFEHDADQAEKRRALAQMFGACLAPMASHLFLLYGPPGTGKSTIIQLAARLVDQFNTCSVDPSEFAEFNMETMAGKLLNYDTDISTTNPIRDTIVKKIEDRVPMRIRRKGLKDIMAPLPAVHIFGGNDIPPTLEGFSRAHSRRWTFLELSRSFIATGEYDREYSDVVFEAGPDGILAFALEGLIDLLNSGRIFFQPSSSRAAAEQWQMSNDPVGRFLADIDAGEVLDNNTVLHKSNEGAVSRVKVYALFLEWLRASAPQSRPMAAHRFYRAIETKGFRLKMVRGARLIEGLSVGPGPNSLN